MTKRLFTCEFLAQFDTSLRMVLTIIKYYISAIFLCNYILNLLEGKSIAWNPRRELTKVPRMLRSLL